MDELLQLPSFQQAMPNPQGMLGAMLGFWLVWPVVCGWLGARRGQCFNGVIQGLMWGPIGLLIILMKGRKHPCPTCGKRALSQPAQSSASVSMPGPFEERRLQSSKTPCVPTVSPEGGENTGDASLTSEEREQVVASACAGYDKEEAARLRAWVNGESLV